MNAAQTYGKSTLKNKITALALSFLCLGATTQATANGLTNNVFAFRSIPVSGTDDRGEFDLCGFSFLGEQPPTADSNGLTMGVKLTVSKNHNIGVLAGLSSNTVANRKWVPTQSIIQWVRVGAAKPIVLEPYNLITQPDLGLSIFSTSTQGQDNAIFEEVQKGTVPIWISFYDKATREKTTYSGTMQANPSTMTQLSQCLKLLWK